MRFIFRGAKNGVIHLWIVSRKQEQVTSPSLEEDAETVISTFKLDYVSKISSSCCDGSPVTSLRFFEEQALLISGHENGRVCVWDIQVSCYHVFAM